MTHDKEMLDGLESRWDAESSSRTDCPFCLYPRLMVREKLTSGCSGVRTLFECGRCRTVVNVVKRAGEKPGIMFIGSLREYLMMGSNTETV